jgi:hypothetical protein
MKTIVHRIMAIGLAFLLLGLPISVSARERRGANVVVTIKEGQTITGELIAVKLTTLLLLTAAGKDESIDVAGIREIKVFKKPRALKGALYGFLAGAVGGIAFAYAVRETEDSVKPIIYPVGAAAGGTVGGLIGLGIGTLAGKGKTIRLEGTSESALKDVLADLRTMARVPDYE